MVGTEDGDTNKTWLCLLRRFFFDFHLGSDLTRLNTSGVMVFVSHLTDCPSHFAFSSVLNENTHAIFSNFMEIHIYGVKTI